jgi:dTDP-4-amino-4,6-dideoxygalactose transaminase
MRKIQLMTPWITDAEKQAVQDVMDSGWLTEGSKVAEFEEAIASYTGVRYAVAVPNATLGLSIVLSEVCSHNTGRCVIPAFTHPATALAVTSSNRSVLFSDVSLHDGNMIGQHVAECCDLYCPDAIIPVSWGGVALDEGVYLNARSYETPIVEDCACGLGAVNSSGHRAGSQADVSVLSFHARKIITSAGEGGMILTNDSNLDSRFRDLKSFGRLGTNLKMSNVSAAVGLEQLKRIDDIISYRSKMSSCYDSLLCDHGLLPWLPPLRGSERRTHQSYCVRVPHRDRLIRDLRKLGVESQIGTYYLPSISQFSCPGMFPNAFALGSELLTLPLHHMMSEEDQEFVVQSIADLLRSYNG